MATTDILLSGFTANVILAATGTVTTNSITANCVISNVQLARPSGGPATFSADITSDGQVSVQGFTTGTNAVNIDGYGGSVTNGLADDTSATFRADFDAWSITINPDVNVYNTFATQWKRAGLGHGNLTGSVTGTLKDDAPFPVGT